MAISASQRLAEGLWWNAGPEGAVPRVWEVCRRRVFSDGVFPAWKKFKELVEYRGTYVRLTEHVHIFTRIVFIPIWRPGQFVVNTLKHWPLPDQAELSTGTPN